MLPHDGVKRRLIGTMLLVAALGNGKDDNVDDEILGIKGDEIAEENAARRKKEAEESE